MEEDYKKEIEKLKEEIKELKKDKEKESFLTETLRWLNIGEAKSKVYLYLLKKKRATAKEIMEEARLYPTTVREVLTEMVKEGVLEREKIETENVGRNPYIYNAVSPLEITKKRIAVLEKGVSELLSLDIETSRKEMKFKPPLIPVKIEIKISETKKKESPEK
ncbi:MAG: helix-turn-helix domain-containing protein [Euryarchaeota archaeon]|nr:helix-turn-helix domain-containing protein [Euryarchaeota archaeon]